MWALLLLEQDPDPSASLVRFKIIATLFFTAVWIYVLVRLWKRGARAYRDVSELPLESDSATTPKTSPAPREERHG